MYCPLRTLLVAAALMAGPLVYGETLIRFEKNVLETGFYGEGASFGDINGDGKSDIVYGPFWFEGPDFTKKHTLYAAKEFSINGYSDNFFIYIQDLTGDGWNDVLVLGFPGKEARLYVNPGKEVASVAAWPVHIVADVVDNESPEYTDLTGDGKAEIVCSRDGQFGYYAPGGDITKPWSWKPLTPNTGVTKFTHGMGVGDVNGDGRMDLMEARRWWAQPKDGTPAEWTPQTFNLTGGGGAQMFAYDFNGDGRNDILSSVNAHQFGVAWFENMASAAGNEIKAQWQKRTIIGQEPWENDYGVRFSQPHAISLVDVDGDGVQDFVTGKRYWAHNGRDPNELDPRVLYWFQTKRLAGGKVEFIPHLIDSDTGVGTQLVTGDIDGDGLIDVVVGNKQGCRVLLQRREQVDAARYAQFQPKKIYGSERVMQDQYKGGQSPQDAVKSLQLPPGFKADVVAAEPDLVQPIAFCWDERGRIWVLEGNTYPNRAPEGEGKDRVLIFSDEDGDGSFETRKVFIDKLNLASGIEVGFGGVWIGSAPNLLFIPDKDRDDKPDGAPVVLLDGWGYQDTHETLNSFIWGPDGWLYGCQGVFTHSKVGKPGTPDDQRTPINAGVWRYHPVKHEFEVFAQGTSNPWGLDYNDKGEFFVTACVIPHLYHILPGGRYQRQAGPHFNPHTYDDIKTIAEHLHYAGNIRDNAHWGDRAGKVNLAVPADTDQAGGGHAHCGLTIYNGDNFPELYRGALLFGNLHGHRLVQDAVEPKGSGYTGQRRPDFMRANDFWFIPVTQKVGPDGALYVSDWSDKQVCHQKDQLVWDRGNGRIYRIAYDTLKPWKGDLGKLSDADLATMATDSKNGWFARMARRVLFERVALDVRTEEKIEFAVRDVKVAPDAVTSQVSRLLLLHALGGFKNSDLKAALEDRAEAVRAAAVRCLYNERMGLAIANPAGSGQEYYTSSGADGQAGMRFASLWYGEAEARLLQMAREDKSPLVRRELASLLQKLPLEKRGALGELLLAHKEDAEDQNIPLLVWYGIEPLVGDHPGIGLALAKASTWENITGFIYRRMAAEDAGREVLLEAIVGMPDADQREKMLRLVVENARLAGKLVAPKEWETVSAKLRDSFPADPEKNGAALVDELSAIFGDAAAISRFRETLLKADAPAPVREAALSVLLQVRDLPTAKACQEIIVKEKQATPLRRKAIQALGALPDAASTGVLVSSYARLSNEEKADAVAALASSKDGGIALMNAVADKAIAQQALSPFLIRQLQALKDADVDAAIAKVWGATNAAKADLPQRTAKWRSVLTADKLKAADKAEGRMIFQATCGTCHTLNGEGSSVGPDLTGSNRGNLDYLLENVLDPNALIGKDYQLNLFTMKDGRVQGGIVKSETADSYRVVMPGGIELTLAKDDVKTREVSKLSTMPEGLFDALGGDMTVKLVAYLQDKAASPAAGGAADATAHIPGAVEGEDMKVLSVTGGTVQTQGMTAFKNGRWSGGRQLWWKGGKDGDVLRIQAPVTAAGKHRVKAVFTKARDYAIVEITRNGRPLTDGVIKPLNFYNPDVISYETDWMFVNLVPGMENLEVKIVGADPAAAAGRMFGLDCLILEAVK